MTFGERLRELRKRQGINQRDLATLVGVDYTYISKIETGDTPPPSVETIHRIALALSADESELLWLAGKVPIGDLVQRVAELESKHSTLGDELAEVQQLLEVFTRKQVKEGPFAPLAQALAYHHEMAMGWARLAATADLDEFPAFEELHTEFAKMYKVVTHYEYVAQQLLGINPSPMADLEDN